MIALFALMYADDIVLLAETEQDLQVLLNALNDWCSLNDIIIYVGKSNIIHCRSPSVGRSQFNFKCGNDLLQTVDRYIYLGLLLMEHLNLDLTAKCIAQSASRALELLISKCKLAGGLPYNVYTKLYDSVVSPVINYAACVWGFKSYSCINAVQNRDLRLGEYTPVVALQGDMGWEPRIVKQWTCICRFKYECLVQIITVLISVLHYGHLLKRLLSVRTGLCCPQTNLRLADEY